jgi:hypothetical protein
MRPLLAYITLGVCLAGCAHKKPPPPPSEPPKPVGDSLRFKAKAGDTPKAKVAMLIDQEMTTTAGVKTKTQKIVLNFNLTEEETVDSVAPEGAQISARLVDVAGTATSGANQEMVDNFAIALDELKISFRRSPRGEVAALTFTGLRNPLDENTAKSILNAIYGGGRGAILPEEPVAVGASWKVQTQVPTPLGVTGDASYAYTYAKKDGNVATVTGEGTLEAKGGTPPATKHLSGKSTSEYHLDIDAGRVDSSAADVNTSYEESSGKTTMAVKQRIKVDWTSQK